MPILWWIWIHNIQERCLLGKDFSLLKAPSFTPSESINISKGRIILIIDNIQYLSMSKLKTSFRCRVPRTGYGGVAAVWWTRGVVLVGAIFFFTGCFIGACSRGCSALRWPGPGPGHTARHAAGHAPPPATPTPPPAPDQLHQLDSCTCVYFTLNLHR